MPHPRHLVERARLDRATHRLDPPFAVLDLAALRSNADALHHRAAGKPIRVATKSVRCRAVLERVLRLPGFRGLMAFTLPEAVWLARSGFDDVLVAYPTADRAALAEVAGDPGLAERIAVTVDDPAQLTLVDAARGTGRAEVRVCLELDTSLHLLGGRLRLGPRRSPLRTPEQVAELARHIDRRPGFRVVGLLAYEGHIAGVADTVPGRPDLSLAIRAMQARAAADLAPRRAAVVRELRRAVPGLEFVNGGGTGNAHRIASEDAVTEIGAGSGLYQPRLFDRYRAFSGRPAAMFALPVVRRSGPGSVTVLGGGDPASGPHGRDRSPVPYLPPGLRYHPHEGAGEVQTPLLGPAADALEPGDRVWFRHAKAGELCERFAELHLVDGESVVEAVPTYRGEGRTFL